MTLYELIHSYPELEALAVVGNDTAISHFLNEPRVSVSRRISKEHLLRWSASTGAIVKLEEAKSSSNALVKALAFAGLSILTSDVPVVTLDDEFKMYLSQLVAASVLTQTDVDKLFERASEMVSLSELNFGRPTSVDEVSHALLIDRPDGIVGG